MRYDNVLLVKREIDGEEQWVFPGTQLFSGEPLVTRMQEAVEEQTGYQVQDAGIYQVYDLFPQGSNDHLVVMDFEAKPIGGELKVGDDVLDVAWVSDHAAKLMTIEENTLALLRDMRVFS